MSKEDIDIKKVDCLDRHEIEKILNNLNIEYFSAWNDYDLRILVKRYMQETGITYKEMVLLDEQHK